MTGFNLYNSSPGETPLPAPTVPTDEELGERFDKEVSALQFIAESMRNNRLGAIVDLDSPTLEGYTNDGNVDTDPSQDIFDVAYDVLRQMGYGIIFTRPTWDTDKMVGLFIAEAQEAAIDAQLSNLKNLLSDDDFHKDFRVNPTPTLISWALRGIGSLDDKQNAALALNFDADMIIRANLAAFVAQGRGWREYPTQSVGEANYPRCRLKYIELAREHPVQIPLRLEECAGMIAHLFQLHLLNHPEHSPPTTEELQTELDD